MPTNFPCLLATIVATGSILPTQAIASLVPTLGTNSANTHSIAQSNPVNPAAKRFYDSAIVKLNSGDYTGAVADLDRAIAIDPNYADAYFNRAYIKQNHLQDYPGAVADYDRYIAFNANSFAAYYARGVIKLERLQNPQDALADFDRTIALNSLHKEAYYYRGFIRSNHSRDYPKALADFDRAIALDNTYAEAYHQRGILKKDRLNDRPGAIRDLQAAAKIYQERTNSAGLSDTVAQLQQLGVSAQISAKLKIENRSGSSIELLTLDTEIFNGINQLNRPIPNGTTEEITLRNISQCVFDIRYTVAGGTRNITSSRRSGNINYNTFRTTTVNISDGVEVRSGVNVCGNAALTIEPPASQARELAAAQRALDEEISRDISNAEVAEANRRRLRNISITNRTENAIRHLYVATSRTLAASSGGVEVDVLARNDVFQNRGEMPAGTSRSFDLSDNSDGKCVFDIRVVFANGSSGTREGINFCEDNSFEINNFNLR
jgi:tetratricopeptide (TPR) repeat protein